MRTLRCSREPRSGRRTRRAARILLAALLGTAAAGGAFPAAPAGPAPERTPAPLAGRPLAEALRLFGRDGLRLVFAESVVRPEMRVTEEPGAGEPRQLLERLLAPHGLAVRPGPRGTLIVVAAPVAAPADAPPAAATFTEELTVTPSRLALLEPARSHALGLGREELAATPHLGDDLFRALSLLPGVSGNDVSAELHVRGGRRDEILVQLDGQELFDVHHLQDYDNALGAVAASALGSVDLATGGFASGFGDRMSGVLDLRTVTPSGSPRVRASAGIAGFELGARGESAGERARWLVVARRGAVDLVGRLIGDEEPSFWDGLARADARRGERTTLAVARLDAGDRLDLVESAEDFEKRFDTDYRSSHTWISLQNLVGEGLLLETAAAFAAIDRDRRGFEVEEDASFEVVDRRDTSVRELRQSGTWQIGASHTVDGGWMHRRIETDFDYHGRRALDDPLAVIRHDGPEGTVRFDGRLDERHDAAHLADRVRLSGSLALEAGARWDRYDRGGESHVSPRLGLAWAPSARTALRAAWGRYDQSQRPYELDVEDGATSLAPVERSEHRVLGLDTRLGAAGSGRTVAIRVELYRRDVDSPRERFEGVFEPVNTFPEIEPDRVRVAPERSGAEGIELFLRGDPSRPLRWWLGYTRASSRDRLDGRWVPRPFDQEHALDLGADFPLGRGWRGAAVWRFHTGWPTTAIDVETVEDEEGEVELVPVLGPLYGERLPDYHRLDLRASRSWRLRSALVGIAIDVQNAYDRANVGGYDVEIDEEAGAVRKVDEAWAGALLTAVVTVEF
jgi:hypothetical protein